MNHATVVRAGRSRFGASVAVAGLVASVGLTVGSTAPSLALTPVLSSFSITPTAFDFGDVPVGSTSATQAVTVTNRSGAPLMLATTGGAATPGTFGGSSDCSSTTLAAGASCHFYYQFSPTATGAADWVGRWHREWPVLLAVLPGQRHQSILDHADGV